ncbi:type 1 glutamine amidotransferase [Lactonifactor longoviformis]|uniref:Aminodeoxychorismate synthase, glutamine amidotransferase subunit n=1 Tax=Lactonifactor longoviformis DSM 17459 TaxID=1122155 RepID=A0A1M4V405_9CLOT|nr:aminodeoxychorismate/anthranilate synthase component II [Lactonifactor longoviformis]POP34537.1 type 1 glutamine amidotransferase [Lactonifactor longoviformis]SHE63613.1 aminodeoxychorismate synthase, glutamine amidotransferase subunit [Lactonifactor longoviformis DSM 17459]
MYLMIDNYDSFVHNLAAYFKELGVELEIVRNDSIDPVKAEREAASGGLEGIIISPGPKSPSECEGVGEMVKRLAGRIPILGVCLGHQIIGREFGGQIKKGVRPMHGKVTGLVHNGKGLFEGLPEAFQVTRYHSLVVDRHTLPGCMEADAWSKDGEIMGMHHRNMPVYSVQFHPEAVLTDYGHELLHNFLKCAGHWRAEHGYSN